jgi:hypothetical protein
MKKAPGLTTGISEPGKVDQYMNGLKHPLKEAAAYLRKLILSTDKSIGESIAWNAPVFYFTGKMEAFDPKEYKRYIVGFNFFKQDTLRIIFLRGADVKDKTGILEGDYKDGRRLISFKNIDAIKENEKALNDIVKQLLKDMK